MADLTVSETIREMREAILRIAAKLGATQVRLIGFVAWRSFAAFLAETKPSISAGGSEGIPRACPKAGEHWR